MSTKSSLSWRRWSPLWGAALALGTTACPAKSKDPKTPGRAVEPRDTAIEHEPCDLKSSGARERKTAEGGPRVIQVFEGDLEVCRAVDLNGDTTIDSFRYFDASGKTRRRESGFDRDALPDQISYYENGVVVRRERETNNDRKIDTWDYYENGKLSRSERDSTGDGFIDQWWVFNRPDDEDCALVTSDADGDGKPDADSEIDICADKVPAKPAPEPTDGDGGEGGAAATGDDGGDGDGDGGDGDGGDGDGGDGDGGDGDGGDGHAAPRPEGPDATDEQPEATPEGP